MNHHHNPVDIFQTKAFRQGISFGVVSSAMTVLGISLGVWSSGEHLRAIVSSVVGLSISNSLADAFSMYMSDTATGQSKTAMISAIVTAIIESILPFLFLIPFLTMKLKNAVIVNAIIGIILVAITGVYVSKLNNVSDKKMVENVSLYVAITCLIMALTYTAGITINKVIKDRGV
jgi:VIT1/CCC1 family predicted Fe2+/Mn2+ transporter